MSVRRKLCQGTAYAQTAAGQDARAWRQPLDWQLAGLPIKAEDAARVHSQGLVPAGLLGSVYVDPTDRRSQCAVAELRQFAASTGDG